MYKHHIMRINYTTYDIRRAYDVINPGTEGRDIMGLLSTTDDVPDGRRFWYARVLGIYHVNVVVSDSSLHRVDFLWVRWFKSLGQRTEFSLESLSLAPPQEEGSLGFIDPQDVVRRCHIVPAFASNMRHADAKATSHMAQDGRDWFRYHMNRCVQQVRVALCSFIDSLEDS
jgi:hypothetical protein